MKTLRRTLYIIPFALALFAIGTYIAVAMPPGPDTLYIGDSMITTWSKSGLLPRNVFAGAVGGEVSSDVLYRWRTTYRAQHWTAALVWMGTNDIAAGVSDERYKDNVREMVWSMQRQNIKHITIVSILPPGQAQAALVSKDRVQALNTWLRSYAADGGLRFVDLAPLVGNDGYLLSQYVESDGLHLTALGYWQVDGIVNGYSGRETW